MIGVGSRPNGPHGEEGRRAGAQASATAGSPFHPCRASDRPASHGSWRGMGPRRQRGARVPTELAISLGTAERQ